MNNYSTVRSWLDDLSKQIEILSQAVSSLPDGNLHISKSGKYYTWRVMYPDGSRKYLPKENESLARQLAKKKFYLAKLNDAKAEARACRSYLKHISKGDGYEADLTESSSDELKRLLRVSFQTEDERAARWEGADYEKSQKYKENLIVPTLKSGEYVRSKAEAILAGCLYELKIPYRYEQITLIGSIKIAVDFTALDIRTFKEIPIELFGMMDNADYRQNCRKKLSAYVNSDYIPGVNMLTFYESSSSPLSPLYIRQVLEDFFFNYYPVNY